MGIAVEQLYENALTLVPEERAKLANLLWESLDPAGPEIDRLWIEEIERRLAAHRVGETETFSAEEVFREFESL